MPFFFLVVVVVFGFFYFIFSLTTFPVMITEAIGLENSGVWSKWDVGNWCVELYVLTTGFSKQRGQSA